MNLRHQTTNEKALAALCPPSFEPLSVPVCVLYFLARQTGGVWQKHVGGDSGTKSRSTFSCLRPNDRGHSRQSNQVIYRVSSVTKTTQVDERERERKPVGVGVQGDETISVYYVYRTAHLRGQQLDDVVDVDSSLISLSVLASISPFHHHPLSL